NLGMDRTTGCWQNRDNYQARVRVYVLVYNPSRLTVMYVLQPQTSSLYGKVLFAHVHMF
ncbi:Hypothetical predicted protein, partial [Mytilus galloprovincialis]